MEVALVGVAALERDLDLRAAALERHAGGAEAQQPREQLRAHTDALPEQPLEAPLS